MSRSVSAPSSVTNTSPCWNGLIVPGSTLMYGSNFCICTFRPRAFSRRPSEAAEMPLPRDDTTPPVTKTYFVGRRATSAPPGDGVRARGGRPLPGGALNAPHLVEAREPGRALDQLTEGPRLAEEVQACERCNRQLAAPTRETIHGT